MEATATKLERIVPGAVLRGVLPDQPVTVVSVNWFGSEALELTYKSQDGRVDNRLLYRDDESALELVTSHGRPWAFNADGRLFRLVSEAMRIRLAHLFDPVLAVHTSLVEPLPHQITAVYDAMLMTGSSDLAVRAAQKLLRDEDLMTSYGGELLRMKLDAIPLWRGDHVSVQQVAEDYASYTYLPKLQDPARLILEAVKSGVGELLWFTKTFAYARAFDENAGRYQDVIAGLDGNSRSVGMNGLIVKADVMEAQVERDRAAARERGVAVPERVTPGGGEGVTVAVDGHGQVVSPEEVKPRRFHGSVELDPLSVGPQASKIAAEVISHLAALVGAEVTITLDIEAKMPDGASTHVVRTVTENAQQLKFQSHGFERD